MASVFTVRVKPGFLSDMFSTTIISATSLLFKLHITILMRYRNSKSLNVHTKTRYGSHKWRGWRCLKLPFFCLFYLYSSPLASDLHQPAQIACHYENHYYQHSCERNDWTNGQEDGNVRWLRNTNNVTELWSFSLSEVSVCGLCSFKSFFCIPLFYFEIF
jgi:hypothetical protein